MKEIFKKVFVGVLAMVMVTTALTTFSTDEVQANQNIRVVWRTTYPDGFASAAQEIIFTGEQPTIIDDRVFLPLRDFEQLPGIESIRWVPDGGTVTNRHGEEIHHIAYASVLVYEWLHREYRQFALIPNASSMALYPRGDRFVTGPIAHDWIDVGIEVRIINDRMMIPLRMLEYMHREISVSWEQNTRTVTISIASN
ncbi:MAG: copper amine oxidase N-terminal domain-containing protein [Defluviitaleaceae bacterium]|nr:copper amine oxidase N-terminal domain-containing protein [Defluviitaleaceae bacterium]